MLEFSPQAFEGSGNQFYRNTHLLNFSRWALEQKVGRLGESLLIANQSRQTAVLAHQFLAVVPRHAVNLEAVLVAEVR